MLYVSNAFSFNMLQDRVPVLATTTTTIQDHTPNPAPAPDHSRLPLSVQVQVQGQDRTETPDQSAGNVRDRTPTHAHGADQDWLQRHGTVSANGGTLQFCDISASEAARYASLAACTSAVGHLDTARLFSTLLDVPVDCNRATLSLVPGDILILGQYTGPRLPEGATSLPEGARVRWIKVRVG